MIDLRLDRRRRVVGDGREQTLNDTIVLYMKESIDAVSTFIRLNNKYRIGRGSSRPYDD